MKTVLALAFALLGLLWGSTWLAADTLAQQATPLRASAVRFLLATLVLLPVILLKRWPMPRGRELGYLFLLSLTMITLPLLLLLWARQQLPSATVTALFALMPLVVILLTPVLEGRLVPNRATPTAIVGLGAIVLATGPSFSAAQAGGAAVVFVAVAATGASSLIARRELKELNPLVVTAFLLGPAALLLFAASMVLERGQSFPLQVFSWNRDAIVAVALLGILGGALPYALYFWLLQKLEAYQLATLQWIQPLVALGEAAIVLRMGYSYSMLAGSVVTLGSVLVVMRARVEDDDTVSLLGN